jgi:DNA polymerase V
MMRFLNQAAQKGLKEIYKTGYSYKRAGVIVMGLTPNDETQLNLFSTSNPKHQPLMSVIDKMNLSYGDNKVKFGMQSLGRQWKMKQDRLSPKFSTKLKDVITIEV